MVVSPFLFFLAAQLTTVNLDLLPTYPWSRYCRQTICLLTCLNKLHAHVDN